MFSVFFSVAEAAAETEVQFHKIDDWIVQLHDGIHNHQKIITMSLSIVQHLACYNSHRSRQVSSRQDFVRRCAI